MAPQIQLAEASGVEINSPIVTLQALLTDLARNHASRPALVCRHQPPDFLHQTSLPASSNSASHECLRWTYSQLHNVASSFAARLHALGIRRGMRIASFLLSGAQYCIGFWAAALLGAVFVPINAVFATKPDDVQHFLGLCEASAIMVWDAKMATGLEKDGIPQQFEKMLVKITCNQAADGDAVTPAGWTTMEQMLAPDQEPLSMPPAEEFKTGLDDLAMIIFTSGTTARPKGVMQTNETFVSMSLSCAQTASINASTRICNSLPLFHIFGITSFSVYWCSGSTVCIPSAAFDPGAALDAIQDEKLTVLAGPPIMLNAIIGHPKAKDTDTTSLKLIIMAAAVILPEVIKAIGRSLSCPRIARPFGMSEGTAITMHRYEDLPFEDKNEISTGPCAAGARVRICEPKSRKVLPRGVAGELHIGGHMVVPGYLGQNSEDMYVDDGSRWLVTGDQAKMDEDGEVYILGRYKDLIIRAGENISPSSIEAVLDSLAGVTSQVVGVPDEVAGEVPVAVVKVAGGLEINQDKMHDVLTTKLDNAFIPAQILTVQDIGLDDFPKTTTGKYQKKELKDIVEHFVHEKDAPTAASSDAGGKLQHNLHQIWAKLLGVSTEKLLLSTPIDDLADSITVMRAVNKIRRDLGREITPQEVMEHPTVDAQAKLLSSKQHVAAGPQAKRVQERKGPPPVAELANTLGSNDRASSLQAAFTTVATPLGLTWEQDVEDVLPIWDWGQIMLHGPRAQSWNHRHAFAATQADSNKLRSALEQALANQSMLRTMAVQESSSFFHVVVRSSPRWYKHVITEVGAVNTAEDLSRLVLNNPQLDFAAAPGPLFRAVIAPIKDTGGSGVVYQAHHSCFDGLSLPYLLEDLGAILVHEKKQSLPARTSYKGFADNLLLHRGSTAAQRDIDFHVHHLQGLAKLERSCWPLQRAPEWFKGNFADVANDYPERVLLDGEKSMGVDGVKRQASLPGVHKLKRDHGLSPPAVLKTALALLNCRYTSTKTAVFANYEAGREWAFQEPWIANLLPNAMDVNGPTLEVVLNKIPIDLSDTCLSMMHRVHEEQMLLTKHAHAPLLDVKRQLSDDGTNLIEIIRRQIFNWLPGLQSDMQVSPDAPLKPVQMQSRSDVGLLWNCGMVGDTFHVTASYDDAQLRAKEVEEAAERWLEIARWITQPENWNKTVGDCPDS